MRKSIIAAAILFTASAFATEAEFDYNKEMNFFDVQIYNARECTIQLKVYGYDRALQHYTCINAISTVGTNWLYVTDNAEEVLDKLPTYKYNNIVRKYAKYNEEIGKMVEFVKNARGN